MRQPANEALRQGSIELVWLAASYAAAYLGLRMLVGQPILDIQMHNTYVVLSIPVAATPLFVGIASLVTATRLASWRWRTPYTVAVMSGLALLWLVPVVLVFLLGWRRLHT